jgi:hypothetical protein
MGWWTKNEEVEEVVEPVDINFDRLRDEAKDHILFMLGAPVLKIELDDGQVQHALDHTQELIDFSDSGGSEEEYGLLLKEGALAFAKYMLGRVRVKFNQATAVPSDGADLVSEGLRDIEAFRIHLGLE